MTNVELARQIVANLEAERDDVLARLAAAETFLATLVDPSTPEVDVTPEAPPPKKKAAAKPKREPTGSGFKCPDCSKVCPTEAGLKTHRGRVHKGSAAKPVPPIETPPAPEPDGATITEIAPAGLMFRCGSCEATTHTRSGLAKHTDAAHRRGLTGNEHVARAAS
jgi:hypothetical protein